MKKVYIVLLNYNGWRDTQECLESVLKLEYSNSQIVVVDNDSPNQSMEHFSAWAEGREQATVENLDLEYLSTPHCAKPIEYVFYDKQTALQGASHNESKLNNPVIFIQSGENGGFAAGNNIGIEYVLSKGDADYIWCLNTDTVVKSDSLTELVTKAHYYKKQQNKVGIIASKLMYYHQPELIQAVGGGYNKWFATTKHIGAYEKDHGQYDTDETLKQMSYPIGASMLVDFEFIKDVGLMCEDYFLYFEEIDWAIRGNQKGWQLGYCWQAIVFHKEGGSIGAGANKNDKSELADYHSIKNRIIFTEKFFPKKLWIIRISFLAVIVNRLFRGQYKRVMIVLKLIFK